MKPSYCHPGLSRMSVCNRLNSTHQSARWIVSVVAACAALFGTSLAHAVPVDYTFTSTGGSGVLDGTTFSDTPVTLTFLGDTANISTITAHGFSGILEEPGTASVSVGSITDEFTVSTTLFLIPFAGYTPTSSTVWTEPVIGIIGINTDPIIGLFSADLSSYNLALAGAFGPLTDEGGAATISSDTPPVIETTVDGSFYWTVAPTSVTFTATPVPVPAAAWLLLSGLGGLGAMARKRKAA